MQDIFVELGTPSISSSFAIYIHIFRVKDSKGRPILDLEPLVAQESTSSS
jgi:hypothetical protein